MTILLINITVKITENLIRRNDALRKSTFKTPGSRDLSVNITVFWFDSLYNIRSTSFLRSALLCSAVHPLYP